jgi:hypothetical protein
MGRPFGPWIKPLRRAGVWARVAAPPVRRLGHNSMRLVPGALINDRGVLAGVGNALVDRLAEVDAVGEDLIDGALGPRLAAGDTGRADTLLRDLARSVQLARDGERRAGLGKAVEDPAHNRRVALDHHQPAVLDFVAATSAMPGPIGRRGSQR